MSDSNNYKHLERRPGSNYKQLFIKGRRIRAEVLYRQTIGLEPQTPAEVADDYDLPLEVVQEAIDYCIHNPKVLQEDRDAEWAGFLEDEKRKPSLKPPDYTEAK
jgi:uncharacterized protein (DUF433 family)